MPSQKKYSIWQPSKEEEEIMIRNFENATEAEKNKISFVQINLGELGIYRAEIPSEARRQFAYDIINTLCKKSAKEKPSKGMIFAKKLLARSFTSLKKSSEGGKNKNQQHNTPTSEDLFK